MNSSPLLAGLEPDRNNAQHLLYTSGYKILQMNPKTETSSMTSKVIYENKFWGWALFSAILATALFFIPFFQQGAGRHAGFVLNGDAWHLLAAQLDYSRFLVHHGIFSGLDFFTHNGASDFFLRPNLPVYHPLVLLLSALFPIRAGFLGLLQSYILLLAVPALFSAFFTHRLASRFLGFDASLSTFVSLGYAFSIQIVDSVWYLPFSMIAWTFPIVIYAGLLAGERQCLRTSFLWSLAPFVAFLSGYVPLCVVSIGLAAATTLFLIFDCIKDLERKKLVIKILWCWSPILIACIFVFPYYIELFQYNQNVEITHQSHSLDIVAYITAEPVGNLLHSLFRNVLFSGSSHRYEFDFFIGIIPFLIIILLFSQRRDEKKQSPQDFLLAGCVTFFFFFTLSIFGEASPISDIFYFFIPVVGYMHLYQRYLVITQFFLIIFLAIGLDRVTQNPNLDLVRKLSLIVTIAVFALAGYVGHNLWGGLGPITPQLVIECIFSLLFLVSFFVFSRKGIILAATTMMFLISLGSFYSFGHGDENNIKYKTLQTITFDPVAMGKLSDYFHQNSNKELIKYVDLLANPEPFVPKNLPWFLLDRVKLSSYYGYDWHLGADYLYRMHAGMAVLPNEQDLLMRPDWSWLQKTGAAFVLYKDGDKGNDPALSSLVDLSDPSRVLKFGPNEKFIFAPLKYKNLSPLAPFNFDNGIISASADDPSSHIEKFKTNFAGKISLQVETKSPITIRYLFWPNKHLRAYIDGKRIAWDKVNDLLQITASAGKHVIEIDYVNILLSLFLILYITYTVLWIAVSLLPQRILPKALTKIGGGC